MEKLKMVLGSRKFWAALVGVAMVILKTYKPDFPIQEEQITGMVYILVAYILGVAIEDAGFNLRGGQGASDPTDPWPPTGRG